MFISYTKAGALLLSGLGIGLTAGLTHKKETYREPLFPEYTGEEMNAILDWLDNWMSQHEGVPPLFPFPIPESEEQRVETLSKPAETVSQLSIECWVIISISAAAALAFLFVLYKCYHEKINETLSIKLGMK